MRVRITVLKNNQIIVKDVKRVNRDCNGDTELILGDESSVIVRQDLYKVSIVI